MAKRDAHPAPQRPLSNLRVLFVELNGSDTTIEEALRTVERMRRAPEPLPRVAKRIANNSPDEIPANEVEPSLFEQNEVVADTQTEYERSPETSELPARRKRGEGQKVDRNAGIELVPNLDFVPAGKVALKQFFAEKAPASDMDRILVIGHYLQHTMELASYSPGHVLAAFRHVGTPVPVDLPATLRNMKKKAWLNYTDSNSITMATEGDNRVKYELPKSKNGAK